MEWSEIYFSPSSISQLIAKMIVIEVFHEILLPEEVKFMFIAVPKKKPARMFREVLVQDHFHLYFIISIESSKSNNPHKKS